MSKTNTKVIDWTIYALDKFASECYKKGDVSEAAMVDATIQLYEEGLVDVQWKEGQPVYSLTPEARMLMDVMKDTPEENALTDIKNMMEIMNEGE